MHVNRRANLARDWSAPLSATIVKQRLKFAPISERLLDLYAEDEISLDQLMAFSVTSDHRRQEEVSSRARSLLHEGALREPTATTFSMEVNSHSQQSKSRRVTANCYERH